MALYKQPASRYWYASYRDADGIVHRRSTHCRDKSAAQSVLSRWLVEAERVKAGIVSAPETTAARHAARPLADHLADYEAALRATGTGRHAEETVRLCRRVFNDLSARAPRDLTPDVLGRWFDARRADGMGGSTANHHLRALKGWGNWMVANGRLNGAAPAAKMRLFNERAERRRNRRALRDDEARALVGAAALRPLAERGRERVQRPKGAKRVGWGYAPLTPDNLETCAARARIHLRPLAVRRLEAEGEARALYYRAAMGSGFRAGELNALTVADFNPATGTFRLDAADEKARRGVEAQPLPRDLADDLAAWVKARQAKPGDKLFPAPAKLKAFDRDLAAAGIAKYDDRGRVLDIHALRGTFITALAKGGVHPRMAQALARHSDIKLTMGAYTDPQLLDAAGAVAALPSLRPSEPAETPENRRAAGAENTPPDLCAKLCVSGGEKGQKTTFRGNEGSWPEKLGLDEKAPENRSFPGLILAPPAGLEPATCGLTVRRSTN